MKVERGSRILWFVVCVAMWSGCAKAGPPQEGASICEGDATLAVRLAEPSVSSGAAPLRVDFEGQVSRRADVEFRWVFEFGEGSVREGRNQPSASFEYATPGVYTVSLTVVDETCGVEYSAETTVEVSSPLELSADEAQASPATLTVLDSLDLSLTVANLSSVAVSEVVEVGFYLSTLPALRWDEVDGLVELGVTSLEPDERGETLGAMGRRSATLNAALPDSTPTGAYYVVGVVDPRGLLSESDDAGNNLALTPSPINLTNVLEDGPDLSVEAVQVSPQRAFRALDSVSLSATLRNQGALPAAVPYAVYTQLGEGDFDPELAVRRETSAPLNVPASAPGNVVLIRGEAIRWEEPISLAEGQQEAVVCVWVMVDPDDIALEQDETNNLARSRSCVTLSSEPFMGVDIAPLSLEIEPRVVALDGTTGVTLEVANEGADPSGSFVCTVFISEDERFEPEGDRALFNLNQASIAPGEVRTSTSVIFVPAFFPEGDFYAYVVCDPSQAVEELREDNNLRALDGLVTLSAESPQGPDDPSPEIVVAVNDVATTWGPNALRRVEVAVAEAALTIRLDAELEAHNALVIYLDVDYGEGTGVTNLTGQGAGAMTDVTGAVDRVINGRLDLRDEGFGAEFAFGTLGLRTSRQGFEDGVGWRHIALNRDDFPWVDSAEAPSVTGNGVLELRVPWQTLYQGARPESATLALFARLTNGDATVYDNRQCLPEDNPEDPTWVGEVLVVSFGAD